MNKIIYAKLVVAGTGIILFWGFYLVVGLTS
jgi:hypothetical protein